MILPVVSHDPLREDRNLYFLFAINVGIEQTEDELEVGLLPRNERYVTLSVLSRAIYQKEGSHTHDGQCRLCFVDVL